MFDQGENPAFQHVPSAFHIVRMGQVKSKVQRKGSHVPGNEVLLSSVLASCNVPRIAPRVILFDREGIVCSVNLQTCSLLGYSREEIVGQSVALFVPEALTFVQPAFSSSSTIRSTACTSKLGQVIKIQLELSVILREGGDLICALIDELDAERHMKPPSATETCRISVNQQKLIQEIDSGSLSLWAGTCKSYWSTALHDSCQNASWER